MKDINKSKISIIHVMKYVKIVLRIINQLLLIILKIIVKSGKRLFLFNEHKRR